jgi:hypothetical protein
VIQLVHGMTSRALNSHDVAAAMSPQNQVRILKTVLMGLQFIYEVKSISKLQMDRDLKQTRVLI